MTVTVVSTLAESQWASADLATSRKEAKYTGLTDSVYFPAIAIESHDVQV